MAQQEGGWPLGLQPLNMRVGLVRNHDFSGSISSNTFLTGSPSSSTDSSSDLDTESTGSFFHDKSITLGSLIGVSSILELSRRSVRGRRTESLRSKKSYKSKTWLFSLCSKTSTYTENVTSPPSLGHFLEVERKAANNYRRNQSPMVYEPDEYVQARPVSEANSLFINGHVAPPQSSSLYSSDIGRRHNRSLDHGRGCGVPILLSCMCGQTSN
ncbi:hypothetical protein BVC80_1835g786 [Macleaya cordata]|uniref:Uncharacterized protein n=1 Tax=Macleaya cordata TaxID=56857 RepID=A0A200R6J3_MACCD|nr:hypothetical protein BVC80_1835g786 [Macleaya cordata]